MQVFIYGTLKRGFPNHHFFEDESLGSIQFICKARTVKKYPLIVEKTQGNLPFLIHCEGKGQIVEGEVYEADDKRLKWLEYFEDMGFLYDIASISVVHENNSVTPLKEETCLCYVMHHSLIKKDNIQFENNMLKYYSLGHAKHYDISY